MSSSSFTTRRRLLSSMVVTAAAGSLGGCATRGAGRDPDPAPPVVRSVALLPVEIPGSLTVENRGFRGAMGMLGIMGTLAAADSIKQNSARVSRSVQSHGVNFGSRLHGTILGELEGGPGMVSVYRDVPKVLKAREADDFLLLGAAADAVLNITVSNLGFHSSAGFDDYTPLVGVTMDLRSPSTNDSLADASYSSYRAPSRGDARHIQTAAEFQFPDLDALVSDSARAARGIEVAMIAIGKAIALDVRTVMGGNFLV